MESKPFEAILAELQTVLTNEREAILSLNYEAIDHAASSKLALDEALRARLPELDKLDKAGKETIRNRYGALRAYAQENVERIQTSLHAVQGLVSALSGEQRPAYGRRYRTQNNSNDAVLTSTLG